MTHGLTATAALLDGEDPKEYEAFRQALTDEFAPVGALELTIVERIISSAWRLRRIPSFETALLDYVSEERRKESALLLELPALGLNDDDVYVPKDDIRRKQRKLGRAIEAMLKFELMGKLSRYESNLQKQLSASLAELQALQERRSSAK